MAKRLKAVEQMTRYIDAEPIKKQLEKTSINAQTTFINTVLIGLLDKAPPADVVEVVHGEWIRTDDTYTLFECSSCKKVSNHRWNFCPNCGAKMDGKKVE